MWNEWMKMPPLLLFLEIVENAEEVSPSVSDTSKLEVSECLEAVIWCLECLWSIFHKVDACFFTEKKFVFLDLKVNLTLRNEKGQRFKLHYVLSQLFFLAHLLGEKSPKKQKPVHAHMILRVRHSVSSPSSPLLLLPYP